MEYTPIDGIQNFPTKLLDAQREGRLVIFAGAGVSRAEPSGLEDFPGLVRKVAGSFNESWENEEKDGPPDVFLGKLQKKQIPVHEKICEVLNKKDSKPNELHSNISRLFHDKENLRIVTTNVDLHFNTAYQDIYNDKPKTYSAPALPLGDEFHGIVYLHGCLEDDPMNMVFTDSDFGRAYLTKGFARRFLLSLFSKESQYVTLFIGYSHNDRVMEFISRGLSPDSGNRYALIPEKIDKPEKWEYFGIEPINFKQEDKNDYKRLYSVINELSNEIQLGKIGEHQRIKEIVRETPPHLINTETNSKDLGFLERSLKEKSKILIFSQYCSQDHFVHSINCMNLWLQWLDEKKIISFLFSLDINTDQDTREIIGYYTDWFANNFVLKNYEQGIQFINKKGFQLNPILWSAIAQKIWAFRESLDSKLIKHWILVLLKTYQKGSFVKVLGYLLQYLDYSQNNKISILILDFLTKPSPILRQYYSSDVKEKIYFNIEILGEKYLLKKFWDKWRDLAVEENAFDLLLICENHIRDADRMMRVSSDDSDEYYDHINVGRSAIEEHEQDQHNDDFYFNVDILRDCILGLQEIKPDFARSISDEWCDSGILLLVRLAIYAISKNEKIDDIEKITLTINNKWLLDYRYRHEIFQLLSVSYHKVENDLKVQLLDDYYNDLKNDNDNTEEKIDRAIYNLTGFLNKYGTCNISREKFDVIQAKYPDWKLSEHVDFVSFVVSGFRGAASDDSAVVFNDKTPEEIVECIFNKQYVNTYDHYDIQDTLRHYSAQNVGMSIEIIQNFGQRNEWKSDYIRSIIFGWQDAELTDVLWEKIISFIENTPQIDYFADAIIEMLKKKKVSDDVIDRLSILIKRIWDSYSIIDEDEIVDKEDWLMASINHPGGKAAELWIVYLSKIREKEGAEWKGIPEPYLNYFNEIIHEEHQMAEMGRILIASQLHLFFYWDEEWTRANLFPEFEFSDDEKRAWQAWHGYLMWGKTNKKLLDEFFDYYKKSFNFISLDSSQMRDRWCEHLAYIALGMETSPLKDWIIDFIKAIKEEDFHKWLYHIGVTMGSWENQSDIENVWNEWLRDYWKTRNDNNPIPMSDKERSSMLDWCIPLKPVFKEVLELILEKSPAPQINEHTSFFHFFSESDITKNYPNESARLLHYILKDQKRLLWQETYLKKWLEDLIAMKVDRQILDEIFDYLELLGYFELQELRKNIQ